MNHSANWPRGLRFVVAALFIMGTAHAQPVPGSRVALVIGNGTYANVPNLPNPVRDAELVAKSLRQAGFQTVQVENNRSKTQFEAALRAFGERAEAAEVAVVYYAGHGLESRGQNWLLPVDAKLERESDLGLEAIRLEDVLETAQRASRMRIVILDACRDNPFARQMRRLDPTRSVTRGLARTLEVSDSLVVYAAKGGTVAQDGSGSNSPFAQALSRRILEPGVELRLMLGRVRDDVLAATSRQQEPFSYGSLGAAEFYFRPGTVVAKQETSPFDPRAAELAFWNAVGSDRDLLQSYLDRVSSGEFPGTYRVIAQARLRPGPPVAAALDDEKILNVYNWADYIDSSVLDDFSKETGIKVNYDVYDSNEVLESKLLAGNSGYDVVVPSASFLERQITAAVFQKLDRTRLPNLRNLDPEITQRIALHDPGNEYSVNYLWGTSGVGYNEAKIRARMPNAPVDSFAMFYDPKVVSKFADCGVTVLDAPSEIVGTVLIFLGKDANSEKPEDLAAAERVLMTIRPYIKYVNSSRYIKDLANGEVCLALGWSGDVLQARDRAKEAGKGITIKYRIPREGAVMFSDMLAVPADARHVENAHLFIDYLLRPDVAAKNTNAVNFANSNAASTPLVSDQIKNDRGIYPSDEIKARLVPDLVESQEFTRLLTRSWIRFRTGK